MSLHFRVSNSSQERRPAFKSDTRNLLRASEVPESPTSLGATCEALEIDGRPCRAELPSSAGDPFCSRHYKDWRDLNTRWSKAVKEAEHLVVTSLDVAKQKVLKLRLSVDLRRQIRDQFYPRGGDIADYIKWIAKLETEVRQLADSLLSECLQSAVAKT